VVQRRDGAEAPTLESIQEHARQHLARYKVPRHLVFVDDIVRSPSGKPDYPWATKLAAAEVTGG
jgi:acyl-CoA synthetase (AMP-forming)/AMP-acid ligase II